MEELAHEVEKLACKAKRVGANEAMILLEQAKSRLERVVAAALVLLRRR